MLATKNQKAVIHILKNEYKISDTDYKQMLYDKYEVFSSIDLTDVQAEEFIHELNMKYNEDYKRGFKVGVTKTLGNKDLDNQFEMLIKTIYDKEPTELEVKMFNSMDYLQQVNLIDELKDRI